MYRSTNIDTAQQLSQQKQLVLLLNGLLQRVRVAERSTQEADIPGKTQAIGAALRILETLRASLDFEAGGSIAEQLAQIYDTASVWLAQGNASNDAPTLLRTLKLLEPIAGAYASLPESDTAAGG
jgi:flagellar protein FliS